MKPMEQQRDRCRESGLAVIYLVVAMVVLVIICSLAVDYGRVQLAKSELQQAADAAARAGSLKLSNGSAAARNEAKRVAGLNRVAGGPLALTNSDIKIGKWSNGAFSNGGFNPNTVQVTIERTSEKGSGIPLSFASFAGFDTMDVTVVATAQYVPGVEVEITVEGAANPWLAGVPNGTVANPNNPHNNPDIAGKIHPTYRTDPRPEQVTGIAITPGSVITFAGISGQTNNDLNSDANVNYGPDGNTGWIVNNKYGNGGPAEHGKSDLLAPINAIVGVFLGSGDPRGSAAPSRLDFSTTASRNFTTLRPQLKQVFFIGDGLTDDGRVQEFVVPAGATRLFIGQMDEYEWNNNRGERNYTISRPDRVAFLR